MARPIDADALMETLKIMRDKNKAEQDDSIETSLIVIGIQEAYWSAIEAVQDAPTIEAEPVRHGHWEIADYADPLRYGCSKCKVLSWDLSNFCPNCDAKMCEVTP